MGLDRKVYFAQSRDMVKVGCSADPEKRLPSLREWVPFEIKLVAVTRGGFSLEARLHDYFSDSWSHGEWFRMTPKIQAVVDAINAGQPFKIPASKTPCPKRLVGLKKAQATRRITKAEQGVYGWLTYPKMWALRPTYIKEAVMSFKGPLRDAPNKEVLAAISRYESELKALDKDEIKSRIEAVKNVSSWVHTDFREWQAQ